MGQQPPCGAGSSYPDPSYLEYLWLGDMDSLGECQAAALEQAANPEPETGACVSVAYYTGTSTEQNFRRQCYCGTTVRAHAPPTTHSGMALRDDACEHRRIGMRTRRRRSSRRDSTERSSAGEDPAEAILTTV